MLARSVVAATLDIPITICPGQAGRLKGSVTMAGHFADVLCRHHNDAFGHQSSGINLPSIGGGSATPVRMVGL